MASWQGGWLLCLLAAPAAAFIAEMPRFSVDELSFEQFDRDYLDNTPVILTGTTICPPGLTLDNVGAHCSKQEELQQFQKGGDEWAGLKKIDKKVSIPLFAKIMKERENLEKISPRYLFDVNTYDYCPGVMPQTRVSGHMSTIFMRQWAGDWKNCSLGHWNMFLAERGFQSDFHTDAQHFSFIASMCTGRKIWRVMRNPDMLKARKLMGIEGGVERKGQLLLAEIPKGFETWNSSLLEDPSIKVFEGILNPGEVIYIPGGAPHAAHTLDNSLMFAANDGTRFSMHHFRAVNRACLEFYNGTGNNASEELKEHCSDVSPKDYEEQLHLDMLKNLRDHGKEVVRKEKPWREAYRCQGDAYCEALLSESGASDAIKKFCKEHIKRNKLDPAEL